MTQIFISSSRKDRSLIDPIINDLEREGYEIWIDSDIPGGLRWKEEMERALERCDFFLLCLSPDAIHSRWVRYQLELARAQQKIIMPAVIRELPEADTLPEVFRLILFIDVSEDQDSGFKQLKKIIEDHVPKAGFSSSSELMLDDEEGEVTGMFLPAAPQRPALPGMFSQVGWLDEPSSAQRDDPILGAVIADRYEIKERIGAGGLTQIFRAFEPKHQRAVVVKLYDAMYSSRQTFKARFKEEGERLLSLQHPYILPIYDYGEFRGQAYLVTGWLEGERLNNRIRRQALHPREATNMIGQLANALTYAHNMGVVHQDLKPESVIIDEAGDAFLADFGGVKPIADDTSGMTLSGSTAIGVVDYAAPEQLSFSPADKRTDIYSLGIMSYEMLTGEKPFQADTPTALILQHINNTPERMESVNPNLPPQLSDVVLKAVAKLPSHRYQTAMEFADAIEAVMAGYDEGVLGADLPAPASPPLVQPQASAPSRGGYQKASELLARVNPNDDQPTFSAFYPEVVQAGKAYGLMVFAHVPNMLAEVRRIAQGYTGFMGDRPPQSSSAAAKVSVDVGSLITFVPQFDNITLNPAELSVAWQAPYQSATFLFSTPPNLNQDVVGRVLVYMGVMVIGEIAVKIAFHSDAGQATLDNEGTFKYMQPIFASYSHKDMPVMEHFRKMREKLGQQMLVDIYDLRAGDHWSERLLEMINESEIFQLFWSEHSADSEYCRQEWQHALKVMERKPRFIQPVRWDGREPMQPPPPTELAHLHFQPVRLPPLTRVQLVTAKMRKMFG